MRTLIFVLPVLCCACSSALGLREFPDKPRSDDSLADAGPVTPDAAMICPSTCAADTPGACALACDQDLSGPIAVGDGELVWFARGAGALELRAVAKTGGTPRVVAKPTAPPTALVMANDQPVWIDGASVLTAKQGSVVTLATAAGSGLAAAGSQIFWTVASKNLISGCDALTCMPSTVQALQAGPTAIAAGTDPQTKEIRGIWIVATAAPREARLGTLAAMSTPQAVVQDDHLIDFVAMDPHDPSTAYAATKDGETTILHIGDGPSMRLTGSVVAITVAAGTMFALVTQGATGSILELRQDGTRDIAVADVQDGLSIAADGTFLYWTTRQGGRVMRSRL